MSMDKKLTKTKEKKLVVKKKAYTPPVLTLYGKLTELTAVGTKTGSAQENSGPDNTKWRT